MKRFAFLYLSLLLGSVALYADNPAPAPTATTNQPADPTQDPTKKKPEDTKAAENKQVAEGPNLYDRQRDNVETSRNTYYIRSEGDSLFYRGNRYYYDDNQYPQNSQYYNPNPQQQQQQPQQQQYYYYQR